tara:strand:+ start:858 stop:1136 length:279 start_codon:yes stop_codon:yes gene_type:complete
MKIGPGPHAPHTAAVEIVFKGKRVQHLGFWKGNGRVKNLMGRDVQDVVLGVIENGVVFSEPGLKGLKQSLHVVVGHFGEWIIELIPFSASKN